MRKNKKALIFMGLIVALMLCVCLAACGGGDYIEKNAKKLSAYTIEAVLTTAPKFCRRSWFSIFTTTRTTALPS